MRTRCTPLDSIGCRGVRPRRLCALGVYRGLPPGLPAFGGGDAVHRVRTKGVRRLQRIADAGRRAALRHRVHGLQQQPAVGHDDLVGGPQVLARAVLDGAHAFAGPLVVHVDVVLAHAQKGSVLLLFGAEAPLVPAPGLGNVVGQRHGLEPLLAHGGLVDRGGEAGEEGVPVVARVVHRHMHLRDGHGLRQRNHEGLRKHVVRDPHMGQRLVQRAQGGQLQPPRLLGEGNLGPVELAHHPRHGPALAADVARARTAELLAVAAFQRGVVEEAVQVGGVRRVDAHFKGLQPVAVPQTLEHEAVRSRRDKTVERREGRRRLSLRAEPGEQRTRLLHQRIAALADALAQRAAHRLGRGFGALASDIELPAMKGAAQAVALVAAIGEVGATVRAVAVQQPEPPLGILEQHEVLAQQPHRLDRADRHRRLQRRVELVQHGHRLPVAPQQLATGGAGADLGQALVLFCFHGRVSCMGWQNINRFPPLRSGPGRCIVEPWRHLRTPFLVRGPG